MRLLSVTLVLSVLLFCGCCNCRNGGNQGTWRYLGGSCGIALFSPSGSQIGSVKMSRNTRYCKPINDGKSIEYAPVILPPKTSAPTEWEYNEAGWYRNAIKPPEVPEGKVVSSVTYRYDEDENSVVADYTFEDAPKPVRTFSKLKLYGALTQAGLWNSFEGWLKTKEINGVNAYTAFSLAQDLNDSNEMFNSIVEEAKTELGVPDEVVEMILNASVLEI